MYWCTVHPGSVLHHAHVIFCPCPPPIFKIYIYETFYQTESSFQIILVTGSRLNSLSQLKQLIKYCPLAWWIFNIWILKVELDRQSNRQANKPNVPSKLTPPNYGIFHIFFLMKASPLRYVLLWLSAVLHYHDLRSL